MLKFQQRHMTISDWTNKFFFCEVRNCLFDILGKQSLPTSLGFSMFFLIYFFLFLILITYIFFKELPNSSWRHSETLAHSWVPEHVQLTQPSQLPRSGLHPTNVSKTGSISHCVSSPTSLVQTQQTLTLIPNLSGWEGDGKRVQNRCDMVWFFYFLF